MKNSPDPERKDVAKATSTSLSPNVSEPPLKLRPTAVMRMTLDEATGHNAYPMRRLVREHGENVALVWLSAVLTEADMMVGGKNEPQVIGMWARMLLSQWGHRSMESIVMAIRDGMTSGKVYGALNDPQISEWLNAHEQAIIGLAESEAGRHKFTGDNLGADYLDRLEKGDETLRMRSELAQLRRKLATKQNDTP